MSDLKANVQSIAVLTKEITMSDLKANVQSIADKLTNGFSDEDTNYDGEPMSAFDYLQDALDIEYIVDRDGEYLGARVLVALGGPNIWINTRTKTVEGYWWSDRAESSFEDNLGLDDALGELWNCR